MAKLLLGAAKMAANMLERTKRPACIEGAQELLAVAANAQREIDDLHRKLDRQEGRAELAEAKAAEAEALIEKLASAMKLINPSMDFAGWESGDGEPIGDLLNEAVSAYTAWKDQP